MTVRSAVIVGVLILLDQITKFLVSANLQLHQYLSLPGGILRITRIHNSGAAFGFLKGMLPIFIFLSIITILLIVLYAGRLRHRYHHLRMGLLLILAGTIGNLIDRLRLGYVIDFIDLKIWPVFNVADISITIGGVFLVYSIVQKRLPS